ncbi:HAD-IA family hydrolase [Nocardia sp. NPDC005745]|uniref:HAD-IA family hydrolase n=1 Tax=Nocardia sp. NPDC005745 TaxID=3157061 RepID=UPI0033E7C480
MAERRFRGLILDFVGVLTSNMVEVAELFEIRERLRPDTFLRAWADPAGQVLYRQLESGEIDQKAWNSDFGALMGVDGEDLMRRLLYMMDPAHEVLQVVREARAAGVRTAVLSNSLGREPYDPYGPYELDERFDVVVLSSEHGIRKPDSAIFELTLDRLGITAESCVFADDSEVNLPPADALGMTVIHALDEHETADELRRLLDLPPM